MLRLPHFWRITWSLLGWALTSRSNDRPMITPKQINGETMYVLVNTAYRHTSLEETSSTVDVQPNVHWWTSYIARNSSSMTTRREMIDSHIVLCSGEIRLTSKVIRRVVKCDIRSLNIFDYHVSRRNRLAYSPRLCLDHTIKQSFPRENETVNKQSKFSNCGEAAHWTSICSIFWTLSQ